MTMMRSFGIRGIAIQAAVESAATSLKPASCKKFQKVCAIWCNLGDFLQTFPVICNHPPRAQHLDMSNMTSRLLVSLVLFSLVSLPVAVMGACENGEEDNGQCNDEQPELSELDRAYMFTTCGSIVKLKHVLTGYNLHSHDIKYGAGSGQQVYIESARGCDRQNCSSVRRMRARQRDRASENESATKSAISLPIPPTLTVSHSIRWSR